MPSGWAYNLADVATARDMTAYVVSVEELNIVGSGEVRSCVLILNASDGRFITNTNDKFGGPVIPLISQFQKLRLILTDDAGIQSRHILEVDKMIPSESSQGGTRLELHLLAQEHWPQVIHFAQQFYYADGFSVLGNLGDKYNASKGSLQASIDKHKDPTFNKLPSWTANNYDFNITETPIYDGMYQLVDALGQAVAGGGAGDFFELYFVDDVADTTKLQLKAFSSGSTPASPVVIDRTLSVNVGKTQGGIESIIGTMVGAWGDDNSGSLPVGFSVFQGLAEAYFLYPLWQSGVSYPLNALVQYDPGTGLQVYQSNIASNTSTPPTNWTAKAQGDIIGNIEYSQWTHLKHNHWKNSGADPANTGWSISPSNPQFATYTGAMWDSNLVIWDGTYYRTWADHRDFSTSNVPIKLLMKNNSAAFVYYRGIRILLDPNLGALSGAWAQNGGKDRFGNGYANAIVMYNGAGFTDPDYRNWDCIASPTAVKNCRLLGVNNQCAVRDVAKVNKWDGANWVDQSGSPRANDCFHPYVALTENEGVSPIANTIGGGFYGDLSAINVTYRYWSITPLGYFDPGNQNYQSIGVWLDWAVPFPLTTDGGIGEHVGGLYGGDNKSSPEPCTLDANNMNLTHTGNTGFNVSDGTDHGAINALGFYCKLQWLFNDNLGQVQEGDFKMRCTVYDTNDNVAIQDFVIPFNNMWTDIRLPLSSFQIYRARIPLFWGVISQIIPVKQLDIQNVFFWKNIKQISIQLQEVYDSQGRYFPEGSRFNQDVMGTTLGPIVIGSVLVSPAVTASLSLWVDSFRFVKPLLSLTTPVTTGRNIEPIFLQKKNITNKTQLDNFAFSMLQIFQFQHKEFEITTQGKCDIDFGDSFYFKNANLVTDADQPDGMGGFVPNTIKLVAKHITYSVNKIDGPGGFIRTILGVRRYNA